MEEKLGTPEFFLHPEITPHARIATDHEDCDIGWNIRSHP
jgi:hypothetical protein